MESYESLVRRTAAACQTPMATLATVERDRARFKASFGATCAEEVPLTFSLLAETLASDDVFLVEDTQADARFASSPVVVAGPRVRAYAGVALYGPDGNVVGVLAVASHIPGSFRAEQIDALRDFGSVASSLVFSTRELALRRLMSRAIEEALDFVLLTDASLPSAGGPYIEYANASLLHALGYTSDELIGKPYSVIFASDNDPATLESIAENLEYAKDNEKEIQLRGKNGRTFWVEFAGRPLLDESGRPSHWVAVGRDITSNRETLAQMAALLDAIDSVTDHVEIYTRENDGYALAFQNAAADSAISAATEKLLADQYVRERLEGGERLVEHDGIALRALGNGATVICVWRQPARIAAVS